MAFIDGWTLERAGGNHNMWQAATGNSDCFLTFVVRSTRLRKYFESIFLESPKKKNLKTYFNDFILYIYKLSLG